MIEYQYTPDEVMLQMYRGERLPTASEQWRLSKAVRRINLKDRNWYVKQRLEYESDEDMGEDTGGVGEDVDLD